MFIAIHAIYNKITGLIIDHSILRK